MPHDLQLWCEDCQVGYEGDCVRHGPLTRVRDTEVDTRARRSIPTILQLRDQQDFTGVYARQQLSKRLQFGPLQAIKVLDGSDKAKEAEQQITQKGGLVVWVSEASGDRYLLDTRQEERTNWMCFVRAAQHRAQQNVVAFQYRGQIFFVTIKEIGAECELRVWYSKDYAERMGTTLLSEESLTWQFRTRERFRCVGCNVVFSSSSSLANHQCFNSGGSSGNGSKHAPAATESTAALLILTSTTSALPTVTATKTGVGTEGVASVAGSSKASSSKAGVVVSGPGVRSTKRGKGLTLRGSALVAALPTRGRQLKSATLGAAALIKALPSGFLQSTYTEQQLTSGSLDIRKGVEPLIFSTPGPSEYSSVQSSSSRFIKRKLSSSAEETESELYHSHPSSSRSVLEQTKSIEEDVPRSKGSKGGTPKRLKTSEVPFKLKTSGITLAETSHVSSTAAWKEGSAEDTKRLTEESSEETSRQTIASEIRAQVLQSVHSLSSTLVSGSLLSQGSQPYISEVVEPLHRVVSIEDVGAESAVVSRIESVEGDSSRVLIHAEQASTIRESGGLTVAPGIEPEDPILIQEESSSSGFGGLQGLAAEQPETSLTLIVEKQEEEVSSEQLIEETGGIDPLLSGAEVTSGTKSLLEEEELRHSILESSIVEGLLEEEVGLRESPLEAEVSVGEGLLEQEIGVPVAGTSEETGGEGSSAAAEGGVEEGREVCSVCGEQGPHTCGSRVFSCPNCNKSFSSRFKLSRHQLIHGGERHYRCNICDRSFHRKDHLKNHLQIHEPTKQFKCDRPGCGKEYNSYMSYRKHCAFHSAEEGDLQCKFCNKMFDNKNDLIYHLKVHVGTRSVKNPSEKKFQCDQCDRRFFTRKDVKRHLVVHTGTRDFCCSLCPQKFGRKDHLVRHIKKSHGITDLARQELLADPLAIPGTSGSHMPSAPLSPGLSSVSTSSGETIGLPSYMLTSSPPPRISLPPASPGASQEPIPPLPSYQDVTSTPSFSGFASEHSDLRLLVGESIKEEPDLTASMAPLGPDLNNMLGLYLPSSEGINMTGIMEGTPTHTIVTTQQLQLPESPSPIQPPPAYSATHYHSLSPLPHQHSFTSSPHTSPQPADDDDPAASIVIASSTSPFSAADTLSVTTTTTAVTTTTSTTTTTSASSSHFLPGFDQAFP
uniref:Protein sister of odd and bowel-like n=2 Tax=Hirondellea gigas TaxID=1518452 RepID=A0A6A7G8K7_9CRUS